MLENHFDRLRSEVGGTVRQPDFGTVRRRARQVRRRRAAATGAVFLATLLTVVGFGYAVRSAPPDRGAVGAASAAGGAPDDDRPAMLSVTATGDDLFVVLARCRDCGAQLYTSSNGGATWQSRGVPPPPKDAATPRAVRLIAVAPGVLLWTERRLVSIDEALESAIPANPSAPGAGSSASGAVDPEPGRRLWITSDGGRAWRPVTVDSQPVVAVPVGMRSVDCNLLRISTCAIGAIDPPTGRFAPLATQPTGITLQPLWEGQVNVPPGGGLWVSGTDPATGKPAVATSTDAGRSWRTHVFTDGVAAEFDHGMAALKYLPQVAAGPGETAYVLTYRADDVVDAHYTADGGKTWRTGDTIRDARSIDDFVTDDGSHVVTTGTGPVAGHGTGAYTPVTLPGFPADTTQATQVTSRQATEPYLVFSETAAYLSKDGRAWRRVRLP